MGRKPLYSKEFKQHAVQLTLDNDRPIAEVARELGIMPHRLYEWRANFLENEPALVERSGETPDQEIARLRAENKRLRQEQEILKKAVAFFSQPPR
jgi:transposase